MSKRVLVVGANSFLGSNFLEYAVNNTGWKLHALVRENQERARNVEHTNHIARRLVVTKDLPKRAPEVIINFASLARPGDSVKDPVKTLTNNSDLMIEWLEYAREMRPNLFVQISTTDAARIDTPYAASKLAQETLCKSYMESFGIRCLIVRPTHVYGKRQPAVSFIPMVVKAILEDTPINVYGTATEMGGREYISADEVSANIISRVERLEYDPFYPSARGDFFSRSWDETILTLGGKGMGNLELAMFIAAELGFSPRVNLIAPPTGYQPRIAQLANQSAFRELSDMNKLAETIHWIADNKEWL